MTESQQEKYYRRLNEEKEREERAAFKRAKADRPGLFSRFFGLSKSKSSEPTPSRDNCGLADKNGWSG